MSNVMEELFEYAVQRKRYSKRMQKSWRKVDDTIELLVQQKNKEQMESIIAQHSSEMRYRGFLDGFWLATKIWKNFL